MSISTHMLNKAGRDVANIVLQGFAVGYTSLVSMGITFFLARGHVLLVTAAGVLLGRTLSASGIVIGVMLLPKPWAP